MGQMRALYRVMIPERWRRHVRATLGRVERVWGPARGVQALRLYGEYRKDLKRYRASVGAEKVDALDLWPCLFDKTETTPVPAHYFHQAAWAARRIVAARPVAHVDVGSQIELTGILSATVAITFVDVRPLAVSLSNVKCVAGSLLCLPFASESVSSLSCLHVIEHVGLGRYGDPLDVNGTEKAAKELCRILAVRGNLFVSTPVGRERTCFNAHRIHSPETILRYFAGLKLLEFSCEDDLGRFRENVDPLEPRGASYTCGLFWFTKNGVV